MSKNRHLWDTKENAEEYNKYAGTFSMYKETSKDLIALAKIEKNMTVVDLAAGTGVTTQEIINKTDGQINIIAIDQSLEMLEKAKQNLNNENIRYIASEAEEFGKKINTKVDVIISNSAFWQMDAGKTFSNVSSVLKKGGIFAFNLPEQFFNHPDFTTKKNSKVEKLSREELVSLANKSGFKLIKEVVKSYEKSRDEVIAFWNIPVMKSNFNSEEDRVRIINKIKEMPDNEKRESKWVCFVFKKQ